MAGTSGYETRWAWVTESTVGTTPATPAFTVSSFNTVNFNPVPNASAQKQAYGNGRVTGHSRSGVTVTGSATGPLVYGEYDDLMASLLQSSWSSDVVSDATTGTTGMTWESTVPQGAGGTNAYNRFLGVEPTEMVLRLVAEQDAEVQMSFAGRTASDATTSAIAGATYTDPTNTNILGSGADVGTITVGAFTMPCIQSATLTLAMEDKDRQPRVGSDSLCGIRRGALVPRLEMQLFVEQYLAIYNAALNTSTATNTVAIQIPLGSVSGEKYTIDIHAAELLSAPLDINGADAFQNVVAVGKYDTTETNALTITRAVA